MNFDSADELNGSDLSSTLDALIQLNAESLQQSAKVFIRNPEPMTDITLTSSPKRESQWDSILNDVTDDKVDSEPSLLSFQPTSQCGNSRERFVRVMDAFNRSAATHLPIVSDVESLPKLCTIRSTVDAYCFHKTTTNDNQLQVARQTMRNILADCLHSNLSYFFVHGAAGTRTNRVTQTLQKLADFWNLSDQFWLPLPQELLLSSFGKGVPFCFAVQSSKVKLSFKHFFLLKLFGIPYLIMKIENTKILSFVSDLN